ncbi:LOW QUALITY PROTEIN: hypothetical protein PHMEG_00016397 [Phytophthora megakarya]|uniref:ZSWIM1/3 RNaseH-like domain-containing protein n=1 Tax=Phytophthora megakarya TaxID=4795 RepID=A0A225W0H3_9STRA|nr:LOW QUALITY PROTEIN: hypothetical protein PHMEG_00016397 [Phytophthora megakarya]
MEGTRQNIVVKETVNIEQRHADLKASIPGAAGFCDSSFADCDETVSAQVYLHSWWSGDRSTGKRTAHKFKTTECPFQMLAQVKKLPSGQCGVVVKREIYAHNYAVTDDIYRSYPGIRQVLDIDVLVVANAGVPSVYNYIRENSNHRVYGRCAETCYVDAKARQVLGVQLSDDDAVAEFIVDFNLVSLLNVSSLHESARGETVVISFASVHMRALLDKFPEVLQMDRTHQANQYNYLLLTVVAMDQFGQSQGVQYLLIETNSDWHVWTI